MEVVVDNRVRVDLRDYPAAVHGSMQAAFSHPNPNAGEEGQPANIETWRCINGEWELPRGGMQRVREVLRAHSIPFKVVDKRQRGAAFPESDFPDQKKALRHYQIEALKKLIGKENALLRAPTGSGKTTLGVSLIGVLKVPTLIVVWATELMEQWMERLEEELGLSRDDIGQIGDGVFKVRGVTVAMQQTLARLSPEQREELDQTFGMVIADEVHRFAAPTLFDCIDPWSARYRFGMSADETRPDGFEFMIYDLFGQVAADIPWDLLVKEGHVIEVDIMVIPTKFAAPWFAPMMRRGGFWAQKAYSRLIGELVANEARNEQIMAFALGELGRGEQIMILSHRVEHCRVLDARINAHGYLCGTMVGGKKGAESKAQGQTRAKVRDGTYRAVVGTVQVVGQGIDLPTLGAAVVTTPVKNKQQFTQVRGRVCRPAKGKTNARLYVMWDRQVFGLKMLEDLCKWNKSVYVLANGQWIAGKLLLKQIRAGVDVIPVLV